MKKILSIILSIVAALLLFNACDPSITAKTSDNIKFVSATYHMMDNLNEPNDKLLKTAELAYTNMYITPEGEIDVTSISFDAKVKKGSLNKELYANVYATEKAQASNKTSTNTLAVKHKLEFSEDFTTFKIKLTAYTFKAASDKESGECGMRVEFLDSEGNANSDIWFSLNNIALN